MAQKKIREGRTVKQLASYVSSSERLSVRRQCELLQISRSNFYFTPKGESDENLEIMRLMDDYHLEHPTYGVLQQQDYLSSCGFHVNTKRVRRLMRLACIEAIYPKRNLSKPGETKYIRPYLLRNLKIEKPNQVWAIDITYIPMRKGFMYLTAIIDIYSRLVVGWDVFNSLDAKNSLSVLEEAVRQYGKPEIINSDQGSQFTCKDWIDWLTDNEITISMDGKRRAIDNIFVERLWRTVKRDHVYLYPADNGKELYDGLKKFFHHYNNHKCHQGIGRVAPIKRYQQVA